MYNNQDFTFSHTFNSSYNDKTFIDYWFKVSGTTKELLAKNNSEDGLIEVTAVVCGNDGKVGIQKVLTNDTYIDDSHDEELNLILKSLVSDISNK